MKTLLVTLLTLFTFTQINSEPVMAKANETRVELLRYLRAVEPMVKNYPGKGKDGKEAPFETKEGEEGERIQKYNGMKRLVQEGIMYYFEGRYPNAYRRFLEAQVNMEQLLEELSQYYIESTDEILKAAMDKKYKSGDKNTEENYLVDKEVVDISVEYGRNTANMARFKEDREPQLQGRIYDSENYHYILNKHEIEGSVESGYKLLGQAKDAKLKALKIESHLEKHQKLQPEHRKYRIERYLEVVARCREARSAAMNIFRLKYPYDNYYLQKDDKVTLEGASNNYRIHPYVYPVKLNPIFDNRIPVSYRRDAVDMGNRIFIDEVNEKLKMKHTDIEAVNRSLARLQETQKLDKPSLSTTGTSDSSGKPSEKKPTPATK
ncbi:MAG: hypothetical protein SFU98_04450 [Leptospiraceae bacterium]|nr:hypothetical protein [Leptospiraceae bacterium]